MKRIALVVFMAFFFWKLVFDKETSLSRDILFRAIKNSVTELGEQGHDAIYGWGLVQATDFNCKN
jgi:hypothetical protein